MMEGQLACSAWIAGSTCTLADYALYPYTKWANEAGIDLQSYPSVLRWLSTVEEQPNFLPLREEGACSTATYEEHFSTVST